MTGPHTMSTRRRRSSAAELEKLSVVEDAKKGAIVPLAGANPFEQMVSRIKRRKDKKAKAEKVSLFSLLRYSTTKERCLMIFGLINAFVSGLGLPAWLVLLAKSLDKFSNLANLINAGADLGGVLQDELNNLVIAFIWVGAIALVTSALYVSIWTYTGEQQALRIKEKYVRSALKQDAAWFDANNREEMPTLIATSMVHINGAIGREMSGVFGMFIKEKLCVLDFLHKIVSLN